MTFAEFERLPDDWFRYELRQGEPVKVVPPERRRFYNFAGAAGGVRHLTRDGRTLLCYPVEQKITSSPFPPTIGAYGISGGSQPRPPLEAFL